MGSQLINVFNVSVCVCVQGCVYFTCGKEHNSNRSVEASPGANADRHQGHQEGKEDKERSTQQQSQCGNLPVCIKSIHKNTTDQFHIVLHCMHYIHNHHILSNKSKFMGYMPHAKETFKT